MKKYLILFALFSIRFVVSQDVPLDLPVLSPQTPTAFEFTKYGEIQVNESTGAISPSIPVFNYNAGPINIPITLQYSGNGVKVNQEPTWAGMNWNVNPGGIITRQVRDLVDEKTNSSYKKFMSYTDLHELDGEGNPDGSASVWAAYLRDVANSDWIDSEVDIFNYNFLGYSGSFFLDDSLNAHLINYDKEVKIAFNYAENNQSGITVTTPNGDVYFFGNDKSDASRSYNNSTPGSYSLSEEAQNAFHLTKIEPVHGGYIEFEYSNMITSQYNYKTGVQESYSVSQLIADQCQTGGSFLPVGGSIVQNDLFTSYSSAYYLTRITSSFTSQIVEFNSSKVGDMGPGKESHHRRRLESIELKDQIDLNTFITLNKCDLNYTIHDTEGEDTYENRFFLTGVDLYGKSITNPQQYKLIYKNIGGLPEKDSYDQDHMGYFNNAGNTTLLPRLDNYEVIKDNENLANREADTAYAMLGALTKIEYPTGGTSEFEYELRNTGSEYEKIPYHMYVYINDAPYPDLETDVAPGTEGFINMEYTDITVNVTATVDGDLTQHNFIQVIAEDMFNPSQSIVKEFPIENPENSPINYTEEIVFDNLAPGTYNFKLNLSLYSPDDTQIHAHADLSLPSSNLVSIYSSGIRVKRITTKEHEGATPMINRYYYNNKENYLEETNTVVVNNPQYVYQTVYRSNCDLLYTDKLFTNLTANSLSNVFGSDAGKVLYPFVTISYGGDNFENGGKELEFKVIKEGLPLIEYGQQIVSHYGSNRSHANSKLKKETIFTKNGSSFTLLKETINTYQTDYNNTFTMHNIMTGKYYNPGGFVSDRLEPFNIGLYETTSYWDYLKSTEIKDYGNSQLTPVITKTDYKYTYGLAGLPTEIIMGNSEGTTNSKKLYYPKIVDSISGLDGTNIDYIEDLEANHQLDEVIRIESFKNTVFLTATQKVYNTWNSNILPERIQFGRDTLNLEDRIVFHDYNSFAKPTLVSKKDGSKTKYFYNNLQQVTVKVDNYDGVTSGETSGPCSYQDFYPSSFVTSYQYDTNTKALISVTQPNCDINYFEYDDFHRLEFVLNKDSLVLEQYNYNYALEELSVSGTASSTSLMVGDQLTLTTTATGGSQNYSYAWTIPGESNLPNSNAITITTTAMQSPGFTAICEVTDTQTLETVSYSEQITVSQSFPALTVDPVVYLPAGSPRRSVGDVVTYSVAVTSGSGSYSYQWSKTNGQSTTIIGSGSNAISDKVTISDCGGFTISCEVTDTNSSEMVTNTKSMTVVCGGGVPK